MDRKSLLKGSLFTAMALSGLLFGAGCSSGKAKRAEQQAQVIKSSKIFCEFVNGENQQDVDVVLNLQMGAKCDFEKPYSITNYKTPADITGLMFCCGVVGDKKAQAKAEPVVEAAAPVAPEPAATPTPTPAPSAAPAATPAPAAAVKQEATIKQEVKTEARKPNSSAPAKRAKPSANDLDL